MPVPLFHFPRCMHDPGASLDMKRTFPLKRALAGRLRNIADMLAAIPANTLCYRALGSMKFIGIHADIRNTPPITRNSPHSANQFSGLHCGDMLKKREKKLIETH